MLSQPNPCVLPPPALPVTHSDPLPAWQELPPECQQALILALTSLLLSQPEVRHEPLA